MDKKNALLLSTNILLSGKMKRMIAVWIVFLVVISGLMGIANLSTATAHDPIYIDGNEDFASKASSEEWAGNGTEANPYIIENYDINASTADGIHIRNTDVHFIIRNCVIHDGEANWHHGIYFSNVTNATIDNVTSHNNHYGIVLYSSSNNKITNCTVYSNYHGIWLLNSSNVEIHYSSIYNNTEYGVWNDNPETEYQVNATHNWWGSTSGPGGVGPGAGDKVSASVLFDPWLIEPLDSTPPTVVSTQPANGAVDVPVDVKIVITFSEPMNTSTIPGNIAIEPQVQIQNYL